MPFIIKSNNHIYYLNFKLIYYPKIHLNEIVSPNDDSNKNRILFGRSVAKLDLIVEIATLFIII